MLNGCMTQCGRLSYDDNFRLLADKGGHRAWGRVVGEVTLAGQPAVHIVNVAYPVSESYRTFWENDEIIIESASLNSASNAIFRQILNSIQWDVN